MQNYLAVLGSEVKALATRNLTFSNVNGASGASGAMLPYMSLINSVSSIGQAGAGVDYGRIVGDPLDNSVVAACVNAIAQALPEAPPYLEVRKGDKWERVDDHEVLELLRSPNADLSDADTWALTVAFEATRGHAYWYLNFDGAKPREIWTLKPEQVTVKGTPEDFISGYRVQPEQGVPFEANKEQVIHFRHLPSPHNARVGWSPLLTGQRQIAGDNAAASYHSAILRNAGVMSLLVSLKSEAAAGAINPEQLQEVLRSMIRKMFGEGAGGIFGVNVPLDVQKMSYSPDEMALDKLISYYETRIAILLGVDPMVVGLGSGTQQKTYANLSEALNDFWERRIVPMRNKHAATLTTQLLPLFGLEPGEWRIAFDYSKVAALQENLDALQARERENYKAGLIDRDEARVKLGYESKPEYQGVFAMPAKPVMSNNMENEPPEQKGIKSVPQPMTDEEIAANTGDFTAEEIAEMLNGRTPDMKALLTAEPDKNA